MQLRRSSGGRPARRFRAAPALRGIAALVRLAHNYRYGLRTWGAARQHRGDGGSIALALGVATPCMSLISLNSTMSGCSNDPVGLRWIPLHGADPSGQELSAMPS